MTVLPKKKRKPVRAEFLADVLSTAVEGGIGYWSKVSDYSWYQPSLGSTRSCLYNVGEANAYVTVHEWGSELEPGRVVTVGVDDMARAMKRIANEDLGLRPEIIRAIRENNYTNGTSDQVEDIDASLADIIMQVAVLGEVIYG